MTLVRPDGFGVMRMKDGARIVLVWTLASLAASCGEPVALPDAVPPADSSRLHGVYAGDFPCGNCPGIEVRLWIREDGVFFLRQEYLGAEPTPRDRIYALGRWRWSTTEARVVLEGRGPRRRFQYANDGRLEMETPSDVAHVLIRQTDSAPFNDSITLDGELVTASEPSTFRECVTGSIFAIQRDAADRDLRRQHRRLSGPDAAALIAVRARIAYPDPNELRETVLVVEQLLSIKPKTHCPERL